MLRRNCFGQVRHISRRGSFSMAAAGYQHHTWPPCGPRPGFFQRFSLTARSRVPRPDSVFLSWSLVTLVAYWFAGWIAARVWVTALVVTPTLGNATPIRQSRVM